MTVMAIMPVRFMNLVAPLAHKATDKHETDTAGRSRARSGAAATVIGSCLRRRSVICAIRRSTRPTTLGSRTSVMATRTTTTRTTAGRPEPSANSMLPTRADVVIAHLCCRRHKRNSLAAIAFERHLERNICKLHERLVAGEYRPGRSDCFVVLHPKPREVWAAAYPDRVVHHLLYNRIAQRFLNSFIADSCACIPGRGTLYAAKRAEHHARSVTRNWSEPGRYTKCDLANFFVSIKKTVLFEHLAARITEPWWLDLTRRVLFHDPRTDVRIRGSEKHLHLVPHHKSLFNAPDDTGLPIGNLDSQFFANVLLNPLDQFVKHKLRGQAYVRYVDDFILMHPSTAWLHEAEHRISAFLRERLQLELNPRKTIRQPIARGIDFVGHLIKPWRTIIRRRTINTAMARLDQVPAADLQNYGTSLFGLLRQSSHNHLDRARLAKALRYRGAWVDAPLTRALGVTHEQ